MLPNPKNEPAGLPKTPIRIYVPLLICFDLITPEFGVRFRPSTVGGAAVPEASINKNSNASRNKDQVRTTTQSRE
jgi:hypothetical protein